MSSKRLGVILAIAVLGSLIFFSCEPPAEEMTIAERIDKFIAGLNSTSRTSLYQNIHPDAEMYNAVRISTFWDAYFPTGQTYSVSSKTADADNVVSTILTGGLYSGNSIKFYMEEDGDNNWKIIKINLAGAGDIVK